MNKPFDPMPDHSLFDLYTPLKGEPAGIVTIPHSGQWVPDEFVPFLHEDKWRWDEDVDYKVNELVDIQTLRENGIVVLVAHVHRVCIDLNRNTEKTLFAWKNNSQGHQLVINEPSDDEAQKLIAKYYRPFFATIESFLHSLPKEKASVFPYIDLHSMPGHPTEYHLKINPNQEYERPDFCLSDQHGKSCRAEYIKKMKTLLEGKGYQVKNNDPYIGGFITEFVMPYPCQNIQIEINRKVYMDEKRRVLKHDISKFKSDLTSSILELFKSAPKFL